MANRHQKAPRCKVCGRARLPSELFSARGKCPECGEGRAKRQTREMREHSGYYFDDWRHRVAASVGGVILDDKRDPN
jgi:predicted RNA-binding Zn-ribbon protein involved in translation (DUF1610 family)